MRVESFECPRAEKLQVARLGEDDLVHRLERSTANNRVSDVPRDLLTVGHHEDLVLFANLDPHTAKDVAEDPRHLGPGVDHDLPDPRELRLRNGLGDFDVDDKSSHTIFYLLVSIASFSRFTQV